MPEKDTEKKLRNEIKKLGGRAYKFISPGRNGVPDRIVILKNGITIFVEMKTEIGKLSPCQKTRIKELRDLHQRVVVIYGHPGVDKFIDLVKRARYDLIPEELR